MHLFIFFNVDFNTMLIQLTNVNTPICDLINIEMNRVVFMLTNALDATSNIH